MVVLDCLFSTDPGGSKFPTVPCCRQQDVWIYVVLKVFAVSLVCCVSISDAWKWAIAFNLGMAVLIAVGQPYMWPQAGSEHSRANVGRRTLNRSEMFVILQCTSADIDRWISSS